LRAEDLLDEIHRQRDLTRKARSTAEDARREAEAIRADLAKRLEKIEDERMQVLDKAHRQAEDQLEAVQDELREVRRQLARTRQPLQVIEEIEEKVEDLQETVVTPVERHAPESNISPVRRSIRLGDKVRLHSLNTQGVVTSLSEEEAEVQVGVLRIRARLAELQLIGEEAPPVQGAYGLPTARELMSASRSGTSSEVAGERTRAVASHIYAESPGIELDLRGQRSEEALVALERYLDSAYLAGLPWVRIIHGKGTGKLRLAVREALGHNPHVKSFESGGDKEGGEGVTVAKLAV
jgi:DNA mismatch repair protein MutS2